MERQRPIWPPGERQAYHAITLGFYENELVRRIDPDHRTIGQLLHEDIAVPLGIADEVFIGTPASVPDERTASLVPPRWWSWLGSMSPRMMFDVVWPRSVLHRSLVANPGTSFYVDADHVIVRDLEVPSGGAVATARAIATAYGAFAAAGDAAVPSASRKARGAPIVPLRAQQVTTKRPSTVVDGSSTFAQDPLTLKTLSAIRKSKGNPSDSSRLPMTQSRLPSGPRKVADNTSPEAS
jgi:hypothetical protein